MGFVKTQLLCTLLILEILYHVIICMKYNKVISFQSSKVSTFFLYKFRIINKVLILLYSKIKVTIRYRKVVCIILEIFIAFIN